jgi:hypothetical protein
VKVKTVINCTTHLAAAFINDEYIETRTMTQNPAYINAMIVDTIGPGNYSFYVDEFHFATIDVDNQTLYDSEGSYVSLIEDLGLANNYFYDTLTCSANTPGDSLLTLKVRLSTDNVTWGSYYSFPFNVSIKTEVGMRYLQFLLNFTASSDSLESPEFFLLELNWTETIANEYPQIGDIGITFDNNTMTATISTLITDPDNDTLTVFLCLLLGDILMNQTGIINGTIVEFNVTCEYETAYEYYLNVTDSEDSVQSSTFEFVTGPEPEPEEEPQALIDFRVILVSFSCIAVLGLLALGKRPTFS